MDPSVDMTYVTNDTAVKQFRLFFFIIITGRERKISELNYYNKYVVTRETSIYDYQASGGIPIP